MREIQDLTIHLSHRTDEVKAQFERAQREFLDWFKKRLPYDEGAIGFRVTAIPVGEPLYIDRVLPVADKVPKIREFAARFAGTTVGLSGFLNEGTPMPAFRGARREMRNGGRESWFSAFSNGVIEMRSKLDSVTYGSGNQIQRSEYIFYLNWILNSVANVANAARAFAEQAAVPECEYGITLEIRCNRGAGRSLADYPFGIGEPVSNQRLPHALDAPLVVEEPMELGDRDAIVNKVLRDFYDACHAQIPSPGVLTIVNWDS